MGGSHQASQVVDGLVLADEQGAHQPRGQVPLGVHGALVQLGQALRVPLQGAAVRAQLPHVAERGVGRDPHGAQVLLSLCTTTQVLGKGSGVSMVGYHHDSFL